jgi:two-component system sensor histidine kinase TctE
VLGYAAAIFAVRGTLRPFDRIRGILAERRPHDTTPLMVASPPETQSLIGAINDAFHRLNERMSKLQGLAGIAAHQIRTPLAALSMQIELLLTDQSPEARAERVARLRAHITRLSRLTNQLLGQAMISYRSEQVPHQRIELVELVHHALRDAVPESLDRDLAVDIEASEISLFVEGDRLSLREALINLISNAVTHGAKSLLRVRVHASAGIALVSVADDGPGIPAALWDSVIQPFQAQRVEGDGAGLGLAIAAEVAKAHGGELKFAFSEDGLFEINLSLPCANGEGE